MIKIAVRSYGRSDSIVKKTIGTLLEQEDLDLGRQLVVAVTQEEYADYKFALEAAPLLDLIIVPKGGHNATNGLIDYFPEGEQIIFMDDDISNVKHYTDIYDNSSRVATKCLGSIFGYGFDRFSCAPFGIDFTPNLMFKQGKPFAEFKLRKIGGAWWGAHNSGSLKTLQSHEDDNIRTARALHDHGGVGSINWLVATTAVGTNKGGMQSSGDRGTDGRADQTKSACLRALEEPYVRSYYQYDPVFIDSMNFYSLRLKNIRELRKQFPLSKELRWSGFMQDKPDDSENTLEDFF
jgi:hypothetical protein